MVYSRPVEARQPHNARRTKPVPHRRKGFFGSLVNWMTHLALGIGMVAVGLSVSLEFVAPHETRQAAAAAVQTTLGVAPVAPVWNVDLDGDGLYDLANPTLGKLRGRDGGKRKHEGADFVAAPGAIVFSPLSGEIVDIGYAYQGKEKWRFIEIKDSVRNLRSRVFYIDPTVAVGDVVQAGDSIGLAASLAERYPMGMTNHVHVELRNSAGAELDPALYLPLGAPPVEMTALTPAPTQVAALGR
jgi:murein DD-endopeptidase MepM/ murein hydrolase activator NlpD